MRRHGVSRPRPHADSRRFVRPVVAAAMLATLVSAIATCSPCRSLHRRAQLFDGGTGSHLLWSERSRTTLGRRGGDCDITDRRGRDGSYRVDAQNDPWIATAASRGLGLVLPAVIPVPADPDRVDVSQTELSVPGSSIGDDRCLLPQRSPHSQITRRTTAQQWVTRASAPTPTLVVGRRRTRAYAPIPLPMGRCRTARRTRRRATTPARRLVSSLPVGGTLCSYR